MQCPKCNGEVWDNRQKKVSGEFKANAPDFACKNKAGCGWNSYPAKDAPPAASAYQQPVPAAMAPVMTAPAVNATQDAIRLQLFWDSFDSVLENLARRKVTDLFKSENICNLVATLYIGRTKNL
jgi:hypothetical protein